MEAFNPEQRYIAELGRRIKEYRIMMGITQQDIEEKSGVSKRSVSRLEQGESVQLETLIKIMIALNIGDNIEILVPDQTRRPSHYLEHTETRPQRVRKKSKSADFQWEDEK